MSYNRMDHAGWLQSHFGRNLTPLERKVADIVGITFSGIYNAPINFKKGWLVLPSRFPAVDVTVGNRSMATFDFNALTLLVFLCHEARIRVQVEPKTRGYWRMFFTQRAPDGPMHARHPNLAEAVEWFRSYIPSDHAIYSPPPATDDATYSAPRPIETPRETEGKAA